MEFKDVIYTRRSVRSFEDRQIEQSKLDLLNNLIAECNREGNLHLQLCPDAGDTFGKLLHKAMGLASAPSVIVCVGPDDETLDERVGYYGEKVVLLAQSLGLNSCWVGMYNKKPGGTPAEVAAGERISIVIALGYGKVQGKEHKSKTPDQVITPKGAKPYWFNYGVEMALLAPTAMNQQKFEIKLCDDNSVEIIDKGGPFSAVDKGIVKYHFEVGARYIRETGAN